MSSTTSPPTVASLSRWGPRVAVSPITASADAVEMEVEKQITVCKTPFISTKSHGSGGDTTRKSNDNLLHKDNKIVDKPMIAPLLSSSDIIAPVSKRRRFTVLEDSDDDDIAAENNDQSGNSSIVEDSIKEVKGVAQADKMTIKVTSSSVQVEDCVDNTSHVDFSDPDYIHIDHVEWGPRPDEEGYDTDQELAVRPKPQRKSDPCHCQPPSNDSDPDNSTAATASPTPPNKLTCLDHSCILWACYEECRNNCPAGVYCGNKRLQRQTFKAVKLDDAGVKGKGLYAAENIGRGEIITEYTGRAVKACKLESLFRRYQLDRRLYIMALDTGVYLDARKKGGLARFINHSCQPNCRVERWKVRGISRAAVVALQDIQMGDELSFDYQWERKRGRAPTKCHCGSPACRGTLEVSKSLEETDLEKELQGHWERLKNHPDQTIVNRTVQIYSKEHEEYFLGEVTGYNITKQLHSILYRHDMSESWEDLRKEDWMILSARCERFVIAKKVHQRNKQISPVCSLLERDIQKGNTGQVATKHYMYVQTPTKDFLFRKNTIELCQRNCAVQIKIQQFARPPLPPNENDPDDVEKFNALDQSHDGTVWKLSITGSDVAKAYALLEKNLTLFARQPYATSPAAGASEIHQVIFPRQIVEAVKRHLPSIREKCRNVSVIFAPSESKSKQIARLMLDGSLVSDIQTAKEHLWAILVNLCAEANVPLTPNKVYCDLGFLAGELSQQQFDLLCNVSANNCLRIKANENLQQCPFFASFESTYRCLLWVHNQEDQGRINSNNQIVRENTSFRKIFIGCNPKDLTRLWSLIQSRAKDLQCGVKYFYLGMNRVFQPLMMKDAGQFFEYVQLVSGAVVKIDCMTGDHLRIDGRKQLNQDFQLSKNVEAMSEEERADFAEEIIKLQIELFRNHCIRQERWIFGRDWSLVASSPVSLFLENLIDKRSTFQGQLDRRSAAFSGTEIADIVSNLGQSTAVAAHAAIILYRFVSIMDAENTLLKVRDAVLACVFIANKAQKAIKWRKLEAILEAGYEVLYPGTIFNRNQPDVAVLEEKVMAAEKEILSTLEFDVFWPDVEWVCLAVTGAGILTTEEVNEVTEFAFSGQILSSGPELWLKYGVEYVFAVAAAFLKKKFEDVMNTLSLIPLKVSQAAELLAATAKLGSPLSKKTKSHNLLEGGKAILLQHIPRIKETCMHAMKTTLKNGSTSAGACVSEATQRYQIVATRNRQRHIIQSIAKRDLQQHILPNISRVSAESSCSLTIAKGENNDVANLVFDGPWRSIALAKHILHAKTEIVLASSLDITSDPLNRFRVQAKFEPGMLRARDIITTEGWEGTLQSLISDQSTKDCKVGGKSCLPGKMLEKTLLNAGLQWWIPHRFASSLNGSIHEIIPFYNDSNDDFDAIRALARAVCGDNSSMFPILTSRTIVNDAEAKHVAVSLQQWPSEKVAMKEAGHKSVNGKARQVGFSAAALQEMQLLTYLHSLVPSPAGHPNFVLPVGVATCRDDDGDEDDDISKVDTVMDTLDDTMFSLFRSSEENELVAEKERRVKSRPHLVFSPTPFVLCRLMKRQKEMLRSYRTVFVSWFHDLVSALVHCHTNHVILRLVQPDQIVIDHNGTLKLSGLYRCTVQSRNDRKEDQFLPKLKRSDKKKIIDDDSFNPYTAPEVLLGSPKFTKASDVWAMGCLLAHLLLGKPLVSGKDKSSLLTMQYKIVGTPCAQNYPEAAKLPRYKKPAKRYKRGVEKALCAMLKDDSATHSKMVDLLDRMLHLDPRKRCSAEEALSHDLLVDFVEQSTLESFQNQFVKEWIALKTLALTVSESERRTEKGLKRKAMLMAGRPDNNDDDDDGLYDVDDLMEPSGKS